MPTKPKHKPPSSTYDCPYCGETYWIAVGNPVPTCDCGFALTLRPEGQAKGMFVLYLQLWNEDVCDGDD